MVLLFKCVGNYIIVDCEIKEVLGGGKEFKLVVYFGNWDLF